MERTIHKRLESPGMQRQARFLTSGSGPEFPALWTHSRNKVSPASKGGVRGKKMRGNEREPKNTPRLFGGVYPLSNFSVGVYQPESFFYRRFRFDSCRLSGCGRRVWEFSREGDRKIEIMPRIVGGHAACIHRSAYAAFAAYNSLSAAPTPPLFALTPISLYPLNINAEIGGVADNSPTDHART